MTLSTVAASLALFAPLAVSAFKGEIPESCPPEIPNCIICKAKAFSTAYSLHKDAFLKIGENIGLSICEDDPAVDIELVANDVAYALAEAVASTSVQCTGIGNAEGSGEAVARAQANATAIASAMVEGFLSVEGCNGCTAAAEIMATATETAFVEAIAESSSQIEQFVPLSLRESFRFIGVFVRDFAKKVLPVFTEILVDVDAAEDTCEATLSTCAGAGDEKACCVVTIESAKEIVEENAYASLSELVTITDEACEAEPAQVTVDESAVAVGKAFASSLSKLFGYCEATTGSDACVWAAGSIEAAAEAEAQACATAIVDILKCDCSIDARAMAGSLQTVMVDTISRVQVDACSKGEGVVPFEDMQKVVEEASVNAIASVFINAFSDCTKPTTTCATAETLINDDSSSATCCVNAQNIVETVSKDALAKAVAKASLAACSDNAEDMMVHATDSAKALAEVSALAIAAFDVECSSTDEFSFACGAGDTTIEATAKATAKTFAKAWADSTDCGTCEVKQDIVSQSVEHIFAEAIASVWGKACTDGADAFSISFFKKDFDSDHLEVVANAIATAAWDQDEGKCSLSGETCVNSANSDEACCKVTMESYPEDVGAKDALAVAQAEAFAGGWLCQPIDTDASAEQFVKATATAWAKVVTIIGADCEAPSAGKACFYSRGSITAAATGFAEAIATAWAGAIGGCGCYMEEDDVAHTTATAVAEITLKVLERICVFNGETYTETLFIEAFTDAAVTVFAEAFAEAKTKFDNYGNEVCSVFVDANTGTH